jgi:hypothetical protein
MTRSRFNTRSILLRGESQREIALAALWHCPLDNEKPLEFVLREEQKARKLDQNAAMWAGPLRDIAEQAWANDRQFIAEVWHEYYKRKYLPEDDDPDLDTLACEGYRKWDIDPDGNRVLVGSTTQLLIKGMAQYLIQIEAHGAGLGVMFHTAPNRG